MNLRDLKQKFESIFNKLFSFKYINKLLENILNFNIQISRKIIEIPFLKKFSGNKLRMIIYLNIKYSNILLNQFYYLNGKDFLYSFPQKMNLNATTSCNYRCKFCEIHYFYKFAKENAGKIFPNHLTTSFNKKYEELLKRIAYIELSGATGEAFVNPKIIELCRGFKKNYIALSATTNASLINKTVAKNLVDMKFDAIMASVHSGNEDNYFDLTGGDLKKVLDNLEYLIMLSKKSKAKMPVVKINCFVSKSNHQFIKELIEKMKKIGVDTINIFHYYDNRNIEKGEVSFFFDPEFGNKFLRNLYKFANSINFKLVPDLDRVLINNENQDKKGKKISNLTRCKFPWENIDFKGCVQHENSHYVSVCSRILLFRLNHNEFDGDFMEDIWNHELIRYFRKTVMKNPICKFCQDPNTPSLRCLDNRQYQIERDKSFQNFFDVAFRAVKIKNRKGIYLLHKNPYAYVNYHEKI